MPLSLPNLDNRTYADLVEEALAIIPTHAPEWTNFNPTDPGMTLVELFAYLSEIFLYRLNQITDAHRIAFLRLLKGEPNWDRFASGTKHLDDEIRDEILRLRAHRRAITCEDFERLARKSCNDVARACCIARRNLELEDHFDPGFERSDELSVVVVPSSPDLRPVPTKELIRKVRNCLQAQSLLATAVRVVGPSYQEIEIRVRIFCSGDAQLETVRRAAENTLRSYFAPLTGGPDGTGWPFGRSVYVSEIYTKLGALPMVDHVTNIRRSDASDNIDEVVSRPGNETRLRRTREGRLIAFDLKPWELVDVRTKPEWIEVERLGNKMPTV